jgi:CRISPR-associated protein Cmr2
MPYLISISIGPVQEFIASARRSRDLWFGSWLLSELSGCVAKTIIDQKGELIFPANLDGNVVNKILAIIPEIDEKLDEKLRGIIESKLKDIYRPIFDRIESSLPKSRKIFYRAEAEAQILDMVEFYWAAIPHDKDDRTIDENGKSAYVKARERVEILLNARKATRDFKCITWGKNVPKSSLDGQRESVINDREIEDDNVEVQRIFNLRKRERLCGVGVLKRLAEKDNDNRFFSTSHIASLPLLDSVKDKRVKDFDYIRELTKIIGQIEEKEFKKIVGKTPIKHDFFEDYDGHLLFEGRLKDFFDGNDLNDAKKALNKFMKDVFGNEKKEPLPYYALLQADGDRMGTVIDNQTNEDDHRRLSKELSKFAGDVKEIVEKNKGCLIYSGGDDVLAFLPLHTVLDCAKELADTFAKKLSSFKDNQEKPPTLSVGIAVYHHTEPLQDALATMRRAEKEAKSVKGKNALAIILSKRSGADTTIKGNWANDRNTNKPFDERLKWFIQLHQDDALPDGVAYELRDLWLRFKDVETLKKPILAEAIRILKRKYSNQGTTQVSKEILDKLETLIGTQETSIRDLQDKLSLEDLVNEIIVARDFAKAYKQANKPAIKGETK